MENELKNGQRFLGIDKQQTTNLKLQTSNNNKQQTSNAQSALDWRGSICLKSSLNLMRVCKLNCVKNHFVPVKKR
jgi:hypothetical protein